MVQPLVQWDATETPFEKGVVWWDRLDKRFLIEVSQVDNEPAMFRIFDHQNDDEELFSKQVSLSYGAIFGPDIGDVNTWRSIAVDFVDNHYPSEN